VKRWAKIRRIFIEPLDHHRQNNVLENLVVLEKGEHSRLHRLAESPRRRDALGRFGGGGVNA